MLYCLTAMAWRESFLEAVYWQVQPEGDENKCGEFVVNALTGGYAGASGDATVCCAVSDVCDSFSCRYLVGLQISRSTDTNPTATIRNRQFCILVMPLVNAGDTCCTERTHEHAKSISE